MVQLVANHGGGFSYVLDHVDVGLSDLENGSSAVSLDGPSVSDAAPSIRGILSLITGPVTVPNGIDSSSSTEMDASEYFLSKEFVLLYFGAGWCPPCKAFSPHLSRFALSHSSSVGAFLVSHDLTEADRAAFVKGGAGGCKHLSYSSSFRHANFSAVNSVAGVTTLPTVVVVHVKTGKMVTNWGKAAVHYNPEHCLEGWRRGEHGISLLKAVCSIM